MTRSLLPALALTLLAPALALAQGMGPAPVEVQPVVERSVAPTRSFVGTVRPTQTSVLGAEESGRVVELLAREGAHVKAGDPVARLRTASVEIDLRAAAAELELRRQELLELENGTRREDLEQAEARFAAAEAELEFARWEFESVERLRETSSVSEDETRRARLRLRAAEQFLAQAKSALNLLRAGPRAERIAQARARVAAQEAAVARLQDTLERHTVRAPFDGEIVEERTEIGEWVSTGDPVLEIAALDEVDVRVGVVEDYVAALKLGAPAQVRVGALPDRVFEGRIHTIVPRGDDRTRTFPVDVRVRNPENGGSAPLKAGMFARVDLEVGTPTTALLVPKDALVLGGAAPIVYVIAKDDQGASIVRPVPVQTGAAVGGEIVVTAQLAAGDLVVTRGNERLRPGQSVAFAPPGTTGAAAGAGE